MRRAPVVLVTIGLAVLLGSYVWYTQRVIKQLDREARQTAELFSRVYAMAANPTSGLQGDEMLALLSTLREFKVPIIVTDGHGKPTGDYSDLPFEPTGADDPRLRAYVAELDRMHPPVGDARLQLVHFGRTQLVSGLEVIPALQASLLGILILVGISVLRTRNRAERERVFAGMAREAAHQLGTPLSSLHGWVELLRESSSDDPAVAAALPRIDGDVERLERVAHRFERIGRPAKRDPIDVAGLAESVTSYFRARMPTLANAITIELERPDSALPIPGDRVLIEWALESLVKNAIDALAGKGGTIKVRVAPSAGSGAVIRVADDGPGIPADLRKRVFAAGFSTKQGGWGIGLSLARRIVEDSHNGRLVLVSADRGAVFDVILPG
jgi:signal transduction histidine kinase